MRKIFLLGLLVLASPATFAQSVPATAAASASSASVADLPAVMVSGVQPGPGLWKVSKGDHVLWILGTMTPLPKNMQWQSREVTQRVLASQEVLLPPSIEVSTSVGFFGKLALLPRLIGIRNNPDGATLAEVVPPAVYARWQVLKAKYMGSNHSVEKWRPLFAGMKLYAAASKQAGLSDKDIVRTVVRKAAKSAGIKRTSTAYRFTVADPKSLVKDFKHERMDDVACFTQMLDSIDTALTHMQARANAWATGDLAALRQQPRTDGSACQEAVTTAGFARSAGLQDVDGKVLHAWLAVAERALAANQSTFAEMRISDLLAPHGYLDALQTAGYTVQAPDATDADEASDAVEPVTSSP
ncbi:MAG: TraB/GumN family protein [Rhodanobacter sp.]